MARPGARFVDPVTAARVRPTSDRRDHLLPVDRSLQALLPTTGLTRGTVIEVRPAPDPGGGGATSLAFSLLAAASAVGWCAAVGVPDAGVLALAEMGVDLDRLVLVPRPGARWAEAVAVLSEAMDVVLLCPPGRTGQGTARQLTARARRHRAVLVLLARHAPWPEAPDLLLTMGPGRWQGVGAGHGHLRRRQVEVEVGGRRGAARTMRADLWLPDPGGVLLEAPPALKTRA